MYNNTRRGLDLTVIHFSLVLFLAGNSHLVPRRSTYPPWTQQHTWWSAHVCVALNSSSKFSLDLRCFDNCFSTTWKIMRKINARKNENKSRKKWIRNNGSFFPTMDMDPLNHIAAINACPRACYSISEPMLALAMRTMSRWRYLPPDNAASFFLRQTGP